MGNMILGFDYRVTSAVEWSESRRAQYLLKPDTVNPLSVDTVVWPSLFCFGDTPAKPAGCLVSEPMDFHQQALGLWASFRAMRQAVDSASISTAGHFVCFTIVLDDLTDDERWKMAFEERVEPAHLHSHWRFQGFDIADNFLLSGLANCGYSAGEVERCREMWSRSINGNGLFENLEDAQKFKITTEERVRSHSPFHVFGVYLCDAEPHSLPPAVTETEASQ